MKKGFFLFAALVFTIFQSASFAQVDPDTAMTASIDRFSMDAGHLFVRDSTNNLPGPNEPINMDMEPFRSFGLGPNGEYSAYYNFDVQPTMPAPIYVLFRDGEPSPVPDQLNIVDDIPGESDYSDFWRVNKVTVPQTYTANTIVSYQQIVDGGYTIEQTDMLVNCPIVPDGSTARLRYNTGEDTALTRGWYDSTVVHYFNFSEAPLMVDGTGMVPLSPIFVAFNINPGEPGGGPPSGFMADSTGRTHNVPSTLPGDAAYSPLWEVNIYDNADFGMVHDLSSALMATILVSGAANVNCPIVDVSNTTAIGDDQNLQPDRYLLEQNYPNPFNPSTNISYTIPLSGFVSLKVYDALGQEVAALVNEVKPAGNYLVNFNASNLVSGIYFYRLQSNGFTQSHKMIILK